MKPETWDLLNRHLDDFPGSKAEPVNIEEIEAAMGRLNIRFHDDYVEFINRYGGAVVGPYPILGLRRAEFMGRDTWSVTEITKEYQSQAWRGVEPWYIVSVDHAGNPIGIAPDGTVWLSDHDSGSIAYVAESFEEFLRRKCMGLAT